MTLDKIDETDLYLHMGDGADTVNAKQIRRGDTYGWLHVDLGAGNDTLVATDIEMGYVMARCGDGHDTVTMSRIESLDIRGRGAAVVYEGNDGNDVFTLSQSTCHNICLIGGLHSDVTILSEVTQPTSPADAQYNERSEFYYISGDYFVDDSQWNCFVALECALSHASLGGSVGNDTMYVADSTFEGNLLVNTGYGGNNSWESTRCHFLGTTRFCGYMGRDRLVSTRDTFDFGPPDVDYFEFVQFR